MSVSQRHRARRLALQGLCCLDVQGNTAMSMVKEFLDDSDEGAAALADAHQMVEAAHAQREQIDATLARHARHWEMGRLAMVDRNILRLACWELWQGQTPMKVVISEALRLAQEFSTAESPRFVNGVLDAVAREMAGEMGREVGSDTEPQ